MGEDEEVDPTVLFSSDSYETILMLLHTDEECEVTGLKALIRTFLFGNQDALGDFPVVEVATRLTELLGGRESDEIRALTCDCIHAFLEAHSESTGALIDAGCLPVLAAALTAFPSEEIALSCLRLFSSISDFRAADIGRQVGIEPMLANFARFPAAGQRSASHAILQVTTYGNDERFAASASLLLQCISVGETTVKSNLGQALRNVIHGAQAPGLLDLAILPPLVQLVNETEDGLCISAFVACLQVLSANLAFAERMLPNRVNYERLFFGPDWKGSTPVIRRGAINVILNLLPDVDLPSDFWILNGWVLPLSNEFARELHPFTLRLLFEKVGRDNLILAAISSTMLVQPLEPSERLLAALAVLAPLPELAPYVLLLVKTLPNPSVIVPYDILPTLSQITPDDKIKEWYTKNLTALSARIKPDSPTRALANQTFATFELFCVFLQRTSLTPFQFRSSGLLDQALAFLQADLEISPPLLPAVEKLVQLAHGVLMLLPNFTLVDPLSEFTPEQLQTRSVNHHLKIGEETLQSMSIGIDLDLGALEAWANRRAERVPYERLASVVANSEFKDLLILPDSAQMVLSHTAILSRGLRVPDYIRYHFRLGDLRFSIYDCVFHALARSLSDPRTFDEPRLLEFCEGDLPRAPIMIPLALEPTLLSSFRLLERIHRLLPLLEVKSAEFARQIIPALSSPLLTIGFYSIQSRILYHFPFLFDFSIRRLFFRIVGFDLSCSLPVLNNHFYQVPANSRTNQMRVRVNVRKDAIYEDGCKVLQLAGPGLLRIDVSFSGEDGIGFGPTQEFFGLFARELCARRFHLWRDSGDNPSDPFVQAPHGLFPAPGASKEQFFLFGLLCGKALLMEALVPLPINPAFFSLVIGEKVEVAEVDPVLARSLAQPEGFIGLPFLYPGSDLELCPGGGADREVTAADLGEFVSLIETKTIELPDIIGEFKRGISMVVPWELLRLFTPKELCAVIAGEQKKIVNEDLAFVRAEHGYSRESPQVQWLFDVVLDMNSAQQGDFVLFVTGARNLPYGGLKALDPPLTIAVRVPERDDQHPDETLPSVMTCTNYFKVPEYSSREILRARVLRAISDGQGSFALS
jgi:hypothetical protein